MPKGRVAHFEYLTSDPEGLAKFLEATFGWKITNFGGPYDYRLVDARDGDDGAGIDGGIMDAQHAPFKAPVCNTIGVGDLDEMMERVKANGGTILTPKGPIPGYGWFCYAQTPDGMPFGMMEPDENAK